MAGPEKSHKTGLLSRSLLRHGQFTADTISELYSILFLGVAVFILVFPWHALNQRLPIWDAAAYVLNAQKIAASFSTGLLAGLKGFYLIRGWRPIIFPALMAPFFMLSGGKILLAVGMAQFSVVWLLASYIFAFLRSMLSPARAVAGALLIVSVQWLINFSNVFYSELTWLAATAGAFYHAASGYKRSSILHLAAGGFWLGIMVAIRPAGSVALALLPSAIMIAYEWKHKVTGGRDLGLFAAQLLVVGVATYLLTLPKHNVYIVAFLLCLACVIIAIAARKMIAGKSVLCVLIVGELVALAWHLPSMRELYLWAYDASFGPMAKLSDQRFSGYSPWSVLWMLLRQYTPQFLVCIVAAAALGFVDRRLPELGPERRMAVLTIVMAILMIVPVLVLLSMSGTSDMRRIMPAMLVFEMGMVALALVPSGNLARLRTVVLLLVLSAQAVSVTANGLNIHTPALAAMTNITGNLRQPYIGVDPNVPVLDGMLGLGVHKGNVSAYTYCYRDYANCQRIGLPVFEPMALSTLAQERHLPIHVHFIGDLDFGKPDTLSAQILVRGFKYVLIDMFDKPVAINPKDPYIVHTEKFIAMEKNGLPLGLINRGCFTTAKRPICVIEAVKN